MTTDVLPVQRDMRGNTVKGRIIIDNKVSLEIIKF